MTFRCLSCRPKTNKRLNEIITTDGGSIREVKKEHSGQIGMMDRDPETDKVGEHEAHQQRECKVGMEGRG